MFQAPDSWPRLHANGVDVSRAVRIVETDGNEAVRVISDEHLLTGKRHPWDRVPHRRSNRDEDGMGAMHRLAFVQTLSYHNVWVKLLTSEFALVSTKIAALCLGQLSVLAPALEELGLSECDTAIRRQMHLAIAL